MTSSSEPTSGKLPLVIGLVVLAGATLFVLLVISPRDDEDSGSARGRSSSTKSDRDPSSHSSENSGDASGTTTSPTGRGGPPLPPIEPAEKPITGNVSREVISGIVTSEEAAQVHRVLTAQLIQRLEELTETKDRDRIRVAIQELADRFYLLDRVVTHKKLKVPGAASLGESDKARVEALLKIWQANLDLSLTVDLLFSQRDLLTDEHVPQMFRRWLESGPE